MGEGGVLLSSHTAARVEWKGPIGVAEQGTLGRGCIWKGGGWVPVTSAFIPPPPCSSEQCSTFCASSTTE